MRTDPKGGKTGIIYLVLRNPRLSFRRYNYQAPNNPYLFLLSLTKSTFGVRVVWGAVTAVAKYSDAKPGPYRVNEALIARWKIPGIAHLSSRSSIYE